MKRSGVLLATMPLKSNRLFKFVARFPSELIFGSTTGENATTHQDAYGCQGDERDDGNERVRPEPQELREKPDNLYACEICCIRKHHGLLALTMQPSD